MDLTGGVFALAGVALQAALSELRAWRDARTTRTTKLDELRRDTYATALTDLDTVAHEIAVWADATATGDEAGDRQVWEAITTAYVSLNKVRLLERRNEAGETMHRLLREYRDVLERRERTLPKTRDLWTTLIDAFPLTYI